MTPHAITDTDLAWWLDQAATLDWTFAKTYAETVSPSSNRGQPTERCT